MENLLRLHVSGIILLLGLMSFQLHAANVTRLKGKVTINGKKATLKMKVSEGDEVNAVGKGNFIDITFENGDVIRLVNGKSVIQKLRPKKSSLVNLAVGKLFIYAKPKKERKFNINTKYTSFAVRGTKFMIEAKTDKDYLCVCEGEVKARRHKDRSIVTSVKKGQDLYSYSDSKLKSAVDANKQMIDMTSEAFADMGFPVK